MKVIDVERELWVVQKLISKQIPFSKLPSDWNVCGWCVWVGRKWIVVNWHLIRSSVSSLGQEEEACQTYQFNRIDRTN